MNIKIIPNFFLLILVLGCSSIKAMPTPTSTFQSTSTSTSPPPTATLTLTPVPPTATDTPIPPTSTVTPTPTPIAVLGDWVGKAGPITLEFKITQGDDGILIVADIKWLPWKITCSDTRMTFPLHEISDTAIKSDDFIVNGSGLFIVNGKITEQQKIEGTLDFVHDRIILLCGELSYPFSAHPK